MNLLLALATLAGGSHIETLGTSASVTMISDGKSVRVDVGDASVVPIPGPDSLTVGLIEPRVGTCRVVNISTGTTQSTIRIDQRTALTSTFVFDPMGNLLQFDPATRRLLIHRTQVRKHSLW